MDFNKATFTKEQYLGFYMVISELFFYCSDAYVFADSKSCSSLKTLMYRNYGLQSTLLFKLSLYS